MGLEIDLAAAVGTVDGTNPVEGANDAGVPAGAELLAFAVAAYNGEPSVALDRARERLRSVVGPDGFREASATIAAFNGLVRVADGTGIQLDPNLTAASAQSREDLGLNQFAGSANTEPTVNRGTGIGSIRGLFGPS